MNEVADTAQNLLEDCRKLRNLLKILHKNITLNYETSLTSADVALLEMYADTIEISLNCLSKIETKIDLDICRQFLT